MKAKSLILAVILSGSLWAQTPAAPQKPDPKNYSRWEDYNDALLDWKVQQAKTLKPAPVKCNTIVQCKAEFPKERDAKEILSADLEAARLNIADLQKRLSEKDKLYDDAVTILNVLDTKSTGNNINDEQKQRLLSVQPGTALTYGISIDKNFHLVYDYAVKLQNSNKTSTDAYQSLVDKYNTTLQQANNIINNQNARLARQRQINNALALYSLMPKSQPVQLPPPPVLNPSTINCLSTAIGNTTYTNCK